MTEHHHNLAETQSHDDLKTHDVSLTLPEIGYLMDVIHRDAVKTSDIHERMSLIDLFDKLNEPYGSPIDLTVDRAKQDLDDFADFLESQGGFVEKQDLDERSRERLEIALRITNPEWLLKAASYLQGEKEVSE